MREIVETELAEKHSPEQIAGRLRIRFPARPEMWASTETIYQSLYVSSRGALKRELTACLRTGRTLRKPGRRTGQRRNRIPDMVNIADRPQEADDRAVPGHWEGDLILGKNNKTAIGTLVQRSTGYAMLVHPPRRLQARPGRASAGYQDPDAPRDPAPDPHLGPRHRAARVKASPGRHRCRDLLL